MMLILQQENYRQERLNKVQKGQATLRHSYSRMADKQINEEYCHNERGSEGHEEKLEACDTTGSSMVPSVQNIFNMVARKALPWRNPADFSGRQSWNKSLTLPIQLDSLKTYRASCVFNNLCTLNV